MGFAGADISLAASLSVRQGGLGMSKECQIPRVKNEIRIVDPTC
jgi:hypothetical protein